MDRHQTLLQLAQRMSAATASDDWKALAAINTLMATTLPKMAVQGPWSPQERAALSALRELHLAAARQVDAAAAAAGQHLSDMTNNKEGWLAYALDSGNAATGT